MSNRQTLYVTRPGFVLDPNSMVRNDGRQVDWAEVPDKYKATAVLVKLNGAASADDTSLTVDALLGDIPAGTLLHFGESKEFARVTVAAVAGGTTLTVEALPSALEDNDEAYFGGNGNKFLKAGTVVAQKVSTGKIVPRAHVPSLAADHATTAQAFSGTGNGVMTLATPDTSDSVLEGAYKVVFIEPAANLGTFQVWRPDGSYDGSGVVGTAYTGSIKFTIADGSTDFIAGDTFTVTVTATYRTIGLLATDADEDMASDAITGYGIFVGGHVYENLLPEATGSPKVIPAQHKAELRVAGISTGWAFSQYSDDAS